MLIKRSQDHSTPPISYSHFSLVMLFASVKVCTQVNKNLKTCNDKVESNADIENPSIKEKYVFYSVLSHTTRFRCFHSVHRQVGTSVAVLNVRISVLYCDVMWLPIEISIFQRKCWPPSSYSEYGSSKFFQNVGNSSTKHHGITPHKTIWTLLSWKL